LFNFSWTELGVVSRKWSDRFIIGLTGNIGTGKSLVRQMLEYMGALGIDADKLAHQAAEKGTPGYFEIIKTFGEEIQREDGTVDRNKLAKIVFDNPSLLVKLEAIIHPIVLSYIDQLIQQNSAPIVVIEAIKLLETDLKNQCNSIWVTTSSPEIQQSRLVLQRGLSEETANQRINVQTNSAEKIKAAQVVISNNGTINQLWQQVSNAWNDVLSTQIVQKKTAPAASHPPEELLLNLNGHKTLVQDL
jgi:dephospho-CoA kinase